MVPTRLAQVAITVEDLDRAKTFYRDRLGLAHLFDAPPGLAFFQCGETRLMLSRPEGPDGGRGSILYYGVEDVAGAYEEMRAEGVAFDEPPRQIAELDGKPIHLAIAQDGEGNRLGLIDG